MKRWWIYQRERFPLAAHGPLIAAFSFCAVALSSQLRGETGVPDWRKLVVAFVTCLIFFLQLRIADEFKDAEEDARYRPYRAVPRGLVKLGELAVVFGAGAAVQLALALWWSIPLTALLLVTWAYLALMSVEFFCRAWLKRRPVVYLVSHMAIMPLVDLYATGTDWVVAGGGVPAGLAPFLVASFFNGIVIEIGRKMRSPDDEEEGVETYTVLWGRRGAVIVLWSMQVATAACALWVARRLGTATAVGGALAVVFALTVLAGCAFLRRPVAGRGKWFEALAGAWTLVLYLALGAWPLLATWIEGADGS